MSVFEMLGVAALATAGILWIVWSVLASLVLWRAARMLDAFERLLGPDGGNEEQPEPGAEPEDESDDPEDEPARRPTRPILEPEPGEEPTPFRFHRNNGHRSAH